MRLHFDTSFVYLEKQRDFEAISSPLSVSLAALMRHDIEHHVIGSSHRISTNRCQIVDALIHIIIYDTLGRGYALAPIERRAERSAVLTPEEIFKAQLGLAPSQIIPVRLATMFFTELQMRV